jgi:hypothetical protein
MAYGNHVPPFPSYRPAWTAWLAMRPEIKLGPVG